MQINGEDRANLLQQRANFTIFFVFLSRFHTLLLSQIVIYFLQILFQNLLQISSVSILLSLFNKISCVFDLASSGIRASTAQIDLLFVPGGAGS